MADYEAPDMNESEQHPIGENLGTHELEVLFQHAIVKAKTLFGRQSEIPLIGPNYLGIIKLKGCKIGIVPGCIHELRHVAIVSRSDTLTHGSALSNYCSRIEGNLLV